MQQRVAAVLAAALYGVAASPYPQEATGVLSPSASAPSGCSINYPGTFGIAVVTMSASGSSTSASSALATAASDGQPGPASSATILNVQSDGQPTAATTPTSLSVSSTSTMAPIAQITDGQIQHQTSTVAPIAQIGDGQIQHQTSTMAPIAQIGDGQIQHQTTTMTPVAQIGDGQIQHQTTSSTPTPTYSPVTHLSTMVSAQPVSAIGDGQPQAQLSGSFVTKVSTSTSSVLVTPSATANAKRQDSTAVGCKSNSTLEITLKDGTLRDNQNRVGSIVANRQFQFDPGMGQAGVIYNSGFSVCGNGSLAVGGSTVFYQCLSGDFYNLYDQSQGGQCMPVTLQTIKLQDC